MMQLPATKLHILRRLDFGWFDQYLPPYYWLWHFLGVGKRRRRVA